MFTRFQTRGNIKIDWSISYALQSILSVRICRKMDGNFYEIKYGQHFNDVYEVERI